MSNTSRVKAVHRNSGAYAQFAANLSRADTIRTLGLVIPALATMLDSFCRFLLCTPQYPSSWCLAQQSALACEPTQRQQVKQF